TSPVASPAAPRVAAVSPFAPTDAPTGTSSVGGSGARAVWHGEQQLHVFRLPATVIGQAVAPLELDERDKRVVRFLEEYGESAFCADLRGHACELHGAQELNAVLYQVSAPASATPCTRCQGEHGTFMTCTYGPGGCGSCRFQHNRATCVLPTVEEGALRDDIRRWYHLEVVATRHSNPLTDEQLERRRRREFTVRRA
ncbi:hypothetical protein KEM55_001551, partial [Ascosphaera atra]